MINYEKYRLSRIVTVQEIESADYVMGLHPCTYNHAHKEAWELCVCLDGEVIVLRDHQQFQLTAGQILFVRPGLEHDITIHKKESTAFVVSFTCSNDDHLRPLQEAIMPAGEAELELFRKMIVELNSTFECSTDNWHLMHLFCFKPHEDSPLGAEQMICCYLEQVIITLLRSVTMQQGQIVRSGQFKAAIHAHLTNQVTEYLDNHIGEHLTVEAIASHFHYSRARLSTIYKNNTGLGINEMITFKRIQLAKKLLSEHKKSVTQISEELGFSSPQYFSHKFTEQVGVSPSKYAASAHSHPETEVIE